MTAVPPVLAVVGLSARLLAEAAARDGHEVLAFDLFGDQDTRRASAHWQAIGDAATLQIDEAALLAGLRLAAERQAMGWVAGSGLEGRPDLLARGASLLPLWGTPGVAVAALREPQRFFEQLRAWGVSFPPVAFERPARPEGWWLKDSRASGGWHIRAAGADDPAQAPAGHYWQQHAPGLAMSATGLAAGGRAVLLGVNRQVVRPFHGRPLVFHGVVGPLAVPGWLHSRLQGLLDRLAATFGLQGLVGVDFLWRGDEWVVLEVNPRPPASLALYGSPGGLMAAHLAACCTGHLPQGEALAALRAPHRLRGLRHVYTRRALDLTPSRWQRLLAWPGVHDVPAVPLWLAAGEPLCSLETVQHVDDLTGDDAAAAPLIERLDQDAEKLLNSLENAP